jgi:hypothetical protein
MSVRGRSETRPRYLLQCHLEELTLLLTNPVSEMPTQTPLQPTWSQPAGTFRELHNTTGVSHVLGATGERQR